MEATEFCKDGVSDVARECPNCIDKYIERAEEIREKANIQIDKMATLLQRYHDACPCTVGKVCALCRDACTYL